MVARSVCAFFNTPQGCNKGSQCRWAFTLLLFLPHTSNAHTCALHQGICEPLGLPCDERYYNHCISGLSTYVAFKAKSASLSYSQMCQWMKGGSSTMDERWVQR
eukprot:scaffold108843_cov20-Tisochrysis_lutea.AAC.1